MKRKAPNRNNRRAVAAVEAAVCLPMLVFVWLATFELTQATALKQQGQFLSSTAAHRVIESNDSFTTIENEIMALANSLQLNGCEVNLQRVDSEIVECAVTIDFAQNSPIRTLLSDRLVDSSYFTYRKE